MPPPLLFNFFLVHTVLLWCVSVREFSSNSFFQQITRELVGKVLFSAIGPQSLDLFSGLPFGNALYLREAGEDFALLRDQARPSVPSVVIDEGYKVMTSTETHVLC